MEILVIVTLAVIAAILIRSVCKTQPKGYDVEANDHFIGRIEFYGGQWHFHLHVGRRQHMELNTADIDIARKKVEQVVSNGEVKLPKYITADKNTDASSNYEPTPEPPSINQKNYIDVLREGRSERLPADLKNSSPSSRSDASALIDKMKKFPTDKQLECISGLREERKADGVPRSRLDSQSPQSVDDAKAIIDDMLDRKRPKVPRRRVEGNKVAQLLGGNARDWLNRRAFVALGIKTRKDTSSVQGIAAIEFADGKESRRWYTYVARAEDTESPRHFRKIANDLRVVLAGSRVVYGNAKDRSLLTRAYKRANLRAPNCEWVCVSLGTEKFGKMDHAVASAEAAGHAFRKSPNKKALEGGRSPSKTTGTPSTTHFPDVDDLSRGGTTFIAVDVETANSDYSSICQVGLVHVIDGVIKHTKSMLIDPCERFGSVHMSIHGIRPEHVKGEPMLEEVWDDLHKQLDGQVLVHHSSFDKTAFAQAAAKHKLVPIHAVWLDSVTVVRRWRPSTYWESGDGANLERVAGNLGIRYKMHDALGDAEAAAKIILHVCESTGTGIEYWLKRVEQPIKPRTPVRKPPRKATSRKIGYKEYD